MTKPSPRYRGGRAVQLLLAVAVAAGSFALSFHAIRNFVTTHDPSLGSLAWLVPIVIDGGVLAGSASIWSSAVAGQRTPRLEMAAVVALLVLSVAINTIEAGPDPLMKIAAGAPPVVLLFCLEMVAKEYRRHVETAAVKSPAAADLHPEHTVPRPDVVGSGEPYGYEVALGTPATNPPPTLAPEPLAPGVTPRPAKAVRASRPAKAVRASRLAQARGEESSAERIRKAVLAHVAAGGDLDDRTLAGTLAAQLGLAQSTVRKGLARVREEHRAADHAEAAA